MLRSKKLLALLILLSFALSLIAHLPASLALKWLPSQVPLRLTGVSGSVWQGQASHAQWRQYSLGSVRWNVQASQIFLGRIEAKVRVNDPQIGAHVKGVVGYGFGGAYAKQVIGSMPAKSAMQFARMPIPVDLAGQFELSMQRISYHSGQCQSSPGSLVWNGSQIHSPLGELALGTIMGKVQCQGKKWTMSADQNNGQLSGEVSANGRMSGRAAWQGWLKPGAKFPAPLLPQLQFLGRPDNQGRFHFSGQGSL